MAPQTDERAEPDVAAEPAPPAAIPLTEPRDGVPAPLVTADELTAAIAALREGTGPVAVDAERASGYRYGQRAYLVQLRRAGVGTILIDPVALPDLSELGDAIEDVEWVLHAATQDLPCLAERGMRP
ncbi:MAG: ribonuclease, partial [Actinomycetota bacterium]|nr:ribonuclease [Actinomycetota bacterium]